MVEDRFPNPFAKVRRLDPDHAEDRRLIRRFAATQESDPADAEDLALGLAESIRDGETIMAVEDGEVVLRVGGEQLARVSMTDLR